MSEAPAPPGDGAAEPGHGDLRLLDIWGGVAPPRQAACWAWLAFLITWVITRAITHHGRGGSSAAILIAGHHVHHYLLGIILLGLTSAVAIFVRPDRWWQVLGVAYGIALALIMDEYALLLNLSDVYWSPPGHLSVDVVLTVIAVGGVYVTGVTVFNEAGRRAVVASGNGCIGRDDVDATTLTPRFSRRGRSPAGAARPR